MIASIHTSLLWVSVLWPLLLALPVLHRRLPHAPHVALLPALALLVLPGHTTIIFPWLLFGAGLSIDHNNRWLLGMLLVIWAVVLHRLRAPRQPATSPQTTFLLLTLSGNVGVVLATDLTAFFAFGTLLGYGFYGLLAQHADTRAARWYVVFLILADLALFESLLLAAFASSDLRYMTVHQELSTHTGAAVYLWMVLLGFVIKAGLWPAHIWLFSCYSAVNRPMKMLLAAVPVAMALLGALRWLPLGQAAYPGLASGLLLVGVITLLLALYWRVWQRKPQIPTGLALAGSGFMLFVAAGLASPAFWQSYAFLAYPLVAVTGLLPLVTLFATTDTPETALPAAASLPMAGWFAASRRRLVAWLAAIKPALRTPLRLSTHLAGAVRYRLAPERPLLERLELRLRRWPVIIGVWLVLAVLIGILAWRG